MQIKKMENIINNVNEKINKKVLFNPLGDDLIQSRKIIGGNTTNLFNLNNVKYSWAKNMYRSMMANFWVPEKVDLTRDVLDYEKLTEDEKKAMKGILSFLIFLDSVQTNNVPNISEYITAPEISTVLAIQTYQEAIHSQSYAYILESVIPSNEREEIYNYWRNDEVLLNRNKHIVKTFQDFIDTPNDQNFARVLIANYILEGIYFYNGFCFFYNLSSRNLMQGTADEIRYINRDEYTHMVLFRNIIVSLLEERPDVISKEMIYKMFKESVEEEIAWANHVVGEKILGISSKSTQQYTKYIANKRLKLLGLKELYPQAKENPYEHLERLADQNSDSLKSNFFESTNTNYSQSSAVDGWDDF